MNIKRYWLSVVASFVAMAIAGMVSSMIFMEQLASFASIGRSVGEVMDMMPLMMAAYFVITMVFCYLYTILRKSGDIKEAIKIGLLFGIMISGITWVNYSMLPFEMPALIADNLINLFTYTVGGIVVSVIYKPAT